MRHDAHRARILVVLCSVVALAAGIISPAGAKSAEVSVGTESQASVSAANHAYLESLVDLPVVAWSGGAAIHGLGDRPAPQTFSDAYETQTTGTLDRGTPPATYDLRTLNRVTAVRDQGPFGTCWSFASCGSLESCLLPDDTQDFSEDHMVLNSGFDNGGDPYNWGGNINMSTAYLVRWGGPVSESDDAYGDGYTPSDLAERKHVQDVNWIPARGSAVDNDGVKNAIMQYGAVYASMGWYGSSEGSVYYDATTSSYCYSGSSGTNHGVLIVGWDDAYAADNFASDPGGDGAFIVKNSWGASWGSGGYFYVSYYDSEFGRVTPLAAFDNAEPVGNYTGVYQYDPLGDVSSVGYSTSTAWFANVFIGRETASLSAVGFYTLTPGTSYEIYTGSSLGTKTLSTSGTLTYMGYHTIPLPSGAAVSSGQPFIVAAKVTSPGSRYPIALEAPYADYSSAATAQAGQSYISAKGSTWTDLTTVIGDANVCLKAYVSTVAPTVDVFAPASGPVATEVTLSGRGFEGASEVAFHGFTADFVVDSGTQITAIVPAGATTGPIAVTTVGGTGTSATHFTVTEPPLSLTVAVPSGTETWGTGSTQNLGWTLNAAVPAGGQFGVWLINQTTGSWYDAGYYDAAPGQAIYTPSFTVPNVPDGAYSTVVYYRVDPTQWVWSANGSSPATATITRAGPAITMTVPSGIETWPTGSTQNLGWTLNAAVPAGGQFGVWLINQSTGSWYDAGYYDTLVGETLYAPSFVVPSIPEGSYKAIVYYRTDPTQWIWQTFAVSSEAATVTAGGPLITVAVPNGTETWAAGSTQNLGWSIFAAVDVGQFGVWLINQTTGSWYDAGYYEAVPGQTIYTPSFTVPAVPAGTYKAIVYYRVDPTQWVWSSNALSAGAATVTP